MNTGPINSGEGRTLYINPTGESNLELELRKADGSTVVKAVDTYLEPGYRGSIDISLTTSLEVVADVNVKLY